MFVKIGDLIKFKGFPVKLSRRSAENQKPSEKWTFLSLTFYNAPSFHTVDWSILASRGSFWSIRVRIGATPDLRPFLATSVTSLVAQC